MQFIDRVFTREENCTGCNKCIAACPVDCANQVYIADDGTRKVRVDSRYCIQCGACLKVCDHNARDYLDDTDRFFEDLAAGEDISVVSAPSVLVNFPEEKRLFGWLASLGVRHFYDVSLGADITTWAYLRVMERDGLTSIISQPCPSIVNYCERYMPEILPALAPIQSPLMCLAIYLRQYCGFTGRIAFLSPCIAKGEEIIDPNTYNLVQYNVTFSKLKRQIAAMEANLTAFPERDFEGMTAGIGLVYSRPGGLRETVRLVNSDLWIRQIESAKQSYPYLREYWARKNEGRPVPGLVDVLNCAGGCNLGTGTDRDINLDDIDWQMNRAKAEREAEQVKHRGKKVKYAPHEYFDAHLKLEDFQRVYENRDVYGSFGPDIDLESAFETLQKRTPESREINCHACGYGKCRRLAQALKRGINVPESCIEFERNQLKYDRLTRLLNHGEMETVLLRLVKHLRISQPGFSLIILDVDDFKQVNDRYGHDAGDIALRAASEIINRTIRSEDFAGRWGGDEFVIALPGLSLAEAVEVARDIREAVLGLRVLPDEKVISISVGVAEAKPGDSFADIFQRADKALYRAKSSKGRGPGIYTEAAVSSSE
ncbi:MAG: diguanylate cyclase [Schwartzia sp.]|nr:diguanylate cyclase [Schwartzia sp. (in: firmicutes)]